MSGATIETKALPRLADFEGKALVHAFEPVAADAAFGTSFFGLVESDFWPYGAVRTESGRWYAYFRTIAGRMTTGLVVMTQGGGPIVYDPRSSGSYTGPIVRAVDGDVDLCAAPGADDDGPFVLQSGAAGVTWIESDILRLSGPIAGPGLQMLNAWREPDGRVGQLFHTHVGFEVHGTVFGEAASGYLGLAKSHLPYGLEWQTGSRFGPAPGFCSVWIAFLNVYDDGSS